MLQFQVPRVVRSALSTGARFAARAPLVAKAIPTGIGFVFGDVLTQHFHNSPGEQHDIRRSMAMLGVGALVAAPLGLGLFRTMFPASATSSGPWAKYVLLDQVLGCIIWQVAYMAIHPPYRAAAQRLLQSSTRSVVNRCPSASISHMEVNTSQVTS
ncbi:hypothetical protein V8C86DRAFT_2527944 [Haematococcus lacustris]